MIKLKRVYESVDPGDGVRFLIERLWPRGMKKEAVKMDAWLKEVAPSNELRKWFGHDPDKWEQFKERYRAELKTNPAGWEPILQAARQGDVTLLYSTHDLEHNNAVVLKQFLDERLG